MVPHLGHTWRMADRAKYGSPFLPRMNSPPKIDGTIINLDPQAFRLAIGSTLQSKVDFLTQLFRVDFLFANRDLVDYANHARQASNRSLRIVAFTPVVNFALKRYPPMRYS